MLMEVPMPTRRTTVLVRCPRCRVAVVEHSDAGALVYVFGLRVENPVTGECRSDCQCGATVHWSRDGMERGPVTAFLRRVDVKLVRRA